MNPTPLVATVNAHLSPTRASPRRSTATEGCVATVPSLSKIRERSSSPPHSDEAPDSKKQKLDAFALMRNNSNPTFTIPASLAGYDLLQALQDYGVHKFKNHVVPIMSSGGVNTDLVSKLKTIILDVRAMKSDAVDITEQFQLLETVAPPVMPSKPYEEWKANHISAATTLTTEYMKYIEADYKSKATQEEIKKFKLPKRFISGLHKFRELRNTMAKEIVSNTRFKATGEAVYTIKAKE